MKKHLIASAAALTACVCLAAGQEFSSDEQLGLTLGWTSCTVDRNDFVGFAVQFQELSGENTPLAISNLVAVANPIGSRSISTMSDQIWIWKSNDNNWDKYFYRSGLDITPGWCKSGDTVVTTDTIPLGTTFFFSRSGGATESAKIAVSGKVKPLTGNGETSVEAGKMVAMAYPWPQSISIQSITYDDLQGGTELSNSADQIWRWDTAGKNWKKYYYYSDGQGSAGWRLNGESENKNTTDSIAIGEGFFFRRGDNASTIKISFQPPQKESQD